MNRQIFNNMVGNNQFMPNAAQAGLANLLDANQRNINHQNLINKGGFPQNYEHMSQF